MPEGGENQRTYEASSSNNINDSSNPGPDNNALGQSKENTKKRSASISDDSGNDGMMMGEEAPGTASKRQKTTSTTDTASSLNTEEARFAFLKKQLMRLGRLRKIQG